MTVTPNNTVQAGQEVKERISQNDAQFPIVSSIADHAQSPCTIESRTRSAFRNTSIKPARRCVSASDVMIVINAKTNSKAVTWFSGLTIIRLQLATYFCLNR